MSELNQREAAAANEHQNGRKRTPNATKTQHKRYQSKE
jgi:hypothetical protein